LNQLPKKRICSEGWEALRWDPLPWLLDSDRPNLHWRTLVELVGRPPASRAVLLSRAGANAAKPVASLLADLREDGGWETSAGLWNAYAGPGWRLVAAVQFGADPSDPRITAAAEKLLETAPGEGGFAKRGGEPPVAWLTARALSALAELGWCGHVRFQEGLAWLAEAAPASSQGGWAGEARQKAAGECGVTAVGVLTALTACELASRSALRERAIVALQRVAASAAGRSGRLGHPCLGRTDAAEMLWALARAGAPLRPAMVPALKALQRRQDADARWSLSIRVPASLPIAETPPVGGPSGWLTLKAVVALMHYAVDAGLERLFPEKP